MHFGHLLLIEKFVDWTFSVGPVTDKQAEFVHDLCLLLYDFVAQLYNHSIRLDIIKEGIWNRFLTSLLIGLLLEDLGKTIPPTTELFGRVENVSVEFLKDSLELILSWME